jgi:hypothetical protein
MYILLTNRIGRIEEGLVLAAGRNTMRVAVCGQSDTIELRLSNGLWISDRDERFEIEALTAGADCEMSQLGNVLRVQVLTAGMPISV